MRLGEPQEERKTMDVPHHPRGGASRLTRARSGRRSAPSVFTWPAEGKAPKTVRTYTEAVQWLPRPT